MTAYEAFSVLDQLHCDFDQFTNPLILLSAPDPTSPS